MKHRWPRFGASQQPKYKNNRCKIKGYSFASQLEASLFLYFDDDPDIEVLKCQDRVFLSAAQIEYRPDFKCLRKSTGEIFWAESKGFETSDWRIKRRLWQSYGPGRLEIYKGSARSFRLHEVLDPKS